MRILMSKTSCCGAEIASALIGGGQIRKQFHDGEVAPGRSQESAFRSHVLDIVCGIDVPVLQRLRAQHLCQPCVTITARAAVDDRVLGTALERRYCPRHSHAELVARVSALGRRYPEDPYVVRVGDLTLDGYSDVTRAACIELSRAS